MSASEMLLQLIRARYRQFRVHRRPRRRRQDPAKARLPISAMAGLLRAAHSRRTVQRQHQKPRRQHHRPRLDPPHRPDPANALARLPDRRPQPAHPRRLPPALARQRSPGCRPAAANAAASSPAPQPPRPNRTRQHRAAAAATSTASAGKPRPHPASTDPRNSPATQHQPANNRKQDQLSAAVRMSQAYLNMKRGEV
jgi:hypothetical protein